MERDIRKCILDNGCKEVTPAIDNVRQLREPGPANAQNLSLLGFVDEFRARSGGHLSSFSILTDTLDIIKYIYQVSSPCLFGFVSPYPLFKISPQVILSLKRIIICSRLCMN